MPHSAKRLAFHRKSVFQDAAIVEMRVWIVPRSRSMPEGYKYSLVYIDSHGRRILGYDNSEGKGHHRHFEGKEQPVIFHSISALASKFMAEVRGIRGELG